MWIMEVFGLNLSIGLYEFLFYYSHLWGNWNKRSGFKEIKTLSYHLLYFNLISFNIVDMEGKK